MVRRLLRQPAMWGFAVGFALLLLWPNLQRLSTIGGFQTELMDYGMRWDQAAHQADEMTKNGDRSKHPSVADLHHEVQLAIPLVYAMNTHAKREQVTKLKLAWERFYLKELEAGRKGDLIQQREQVALLARLVALHIREVPDTATAPPAINQMGITLRQAVPVLWVQLFLALWCGYFVFADKRRDTAALINVLPVSLTRWVLSHGLGFAAVACGLVLLVFGAVFSGLSLTVGVGDWAYPLAYSRDGVHVLFMPVVRYLTESLGIVMASIVFWTGLAAVAQLFTRQLIVAWALLAAVAAIGVRTTATWLPTSYLDWRQVVAPVHASGLWPVGAGMAWLVLWGLAALAVVGIISERRGRL